MISVQELTGTGTPLVSRVAALERMTGPNTFWVPQKPGTKVPACSYVWRPLEDTRSAAYRALLEECNLAVYLGAASAGLCAIDFDDEADAAAWDAVNPKLAGTLRSKGARGCQVLVRIRGKIPESVSPGHFEWRADKRLSTLSGVHPSGVEYRLLVAAPPMEVEFKDIHWPEGWMVPGDTEKESALEAELGAPMDYNKNGVPVKLNQGFFAARFCAENDVLWDPAMGRFFRYEEATGLWCARTDDEIGKLVTAGVRELVNQAAAAAGADGGPALRKAHFLNNAQFLAGVIKLLKGQALERDRFTKPAGIIHTLNGMIDLNEQPWALKPFDKSYYSRNQITVRYDPAAQCPRFLEDLLGPQLDADDQRLLQLWSGQALLHNNLFQVFLVLTGTAGGGKGTLTRLIKLMIGERNCYELRTRHLDGRFEIGFYNGRSLLLGSDVDPDFLSTEGAQRLKAMTGGDALSGEVKGSMDAHSLVGDWNVLITCNSRLMFKLQGDAPAWARRLLWLPFEKPKPENPVPNFEHLLFQQEGSGIFNWMLAGAVALLKLASQNKPFPQTQRQRDRVLGLIAESDSVREFLLRRVRRSCFPTDCITSEALYRAYLMTCEDQNWTALGQRAFSNRSEDIMVAEFRAHRSHNIPIEGGKTARGWIGVTLGEDTTETVNDDQNEPF